MAKSAFRVGLMDPVVAARPTADTFSRMSYLSAAASRVDSYWVPDHINGVTLRPLWDPKYTASARILRSPDAPMEVKDREQQILTPTIINEPSKWPGQEGIP
jgi:phthiodiolone/phenolphthiodiolone dimycocerosates ketoreductase